MLLDKRIKMQWMMCGMLFLMLFLLLIPSIFTFASEQEESNKKRVLFLSSYNLNFETVPSQIEGIRSVFEENGIECDIEFLDAKRFVDTQYQHAFSLLLEYKLSRLPKYDIILLGDDNALMFGQNYQETLFSGIPLVFFGVNNAGQALRAAQKEMVTGIIEEASLEETIDVAVLLLPKADKIVAILDNTLTGIGERSQFYRMIEEFPELDFSEINSSYFSYQEVGQKIAALDHDTILIYFCMNEDRDGNIMTQGEEIDLILKNAKIPVFQQFIGGMGKGILGGKIVDYEKMGEMAAQMAVDIINGAPVDETEVISESPCSYIFDRNVMKQYNLNMRLLPKESIILNDKEGFIERYRVVLIPMLILLSITLVVAGLLFFDNRRKKKYAEILIENNERLTQTHEELAAAEEELRHQYTTIYEYSRNIEELANNDFLTSLPNRRCFMEKLNAVMKRDDSGSVIMIDIDNFKYYNDALGHVFGDELLKETAKRLSSLENDKYYISRFGGDEFLILIMEDDLEYISCIIKKIQDLFIQPVVIMNKENYIQLSIGIARFPVDAKDATFLLSCADNAMYQAKRRGKNNYVFYQNFMQEELKERSHIEDILRTAIAEDGFMLVYQPQVDVFTGEIKGFEALVRLKYYRVSPDKFIQIAEESNLIHGIGRIITRISIEQLVEWREKGYDLKPISINFSCKQIRDEDYLNYLSSLLDQYEIDPKYLEIEITESVFLDTTDESYAYLSQIRGMGIQIALDDFGTGYSSINYLTYIPISKLKLDKSLADKFLKHKDRRTIESIIMLAHSLDLIIVAEGIEEWEQYEKLKECGCDIIQGYFFSRPLDPDSVDYIYHQNLLDLAVEACKLERDSC